MMTLLTGPQRNKKGPQCGFTLIELIVVMTMMIIVLGIVFPSLKGFFQGRVLDNEASRFLSLTRFAQSRAISEGLPIDVWINTKQGSYGLEAEAGYTETQSGAKSYGVSPEVQVTVSLPPSITSTTRSNYWTQSTKRAQTVPTIRFQPAGFVDETSPQTVIFHQGDSVIRVVETPTHLRYEIQTSANYRR